MVLTNKEIDRFCQANGVTEPRQREAVHDAVRAMEKAEGRAALVRMHDSHTEESRRFLEGLPEDTYKDDEHDLGGDFSKALLAAAKTYEEGLCNQTLKATLQVMVELGYSQDQCRKLERAARFRMQLRP